MPAESGDDSEAAVHDAAAELRTFVHSVMPAALVERGLCESGLGEAVVKRLRRRTRPGY